ncbi:glucose 1-dehydrogenase [Thalassococcus sp. S3]|uniref:glucose 1-dehydrogenase n=1 Tax=Thalassococcus sp. S3 TaxID=2017482 RepID=UPI0010241F4D|nr:glucose 1-dehydrogenase [Thalassococcus sp. S3]QBF31324.1 short chain dehydrogenase [Thalassococcus sp. S3]
MIDMSGKVALVTGAAAGIGRSAALRFGEAGARVIVSDIAEDGGHETVDLIQETGGEATFIRTDAAQEKDVEVLVSTIVQQFGSLDYACNNAGIEGNVRPLIEQTPDDFDRVISINLRGTFLCLKAEITQMLQAGGGAIVNLASAAGLIGFPGLSPYVASKHGVNGLTKAAAVEYGAQGVRVNSICPGGIDTRMLDSLADQATGGTQGSSEMMAPLHPMGRIGTPEEVANLIVWLCSEQASFVTGANIPVDGGFVAQ